MEVVYLRTTGSLVRRRGERLEVWKGNRKLGDLRPFQLDRLVLVGSVQLTSQAITLLLDRGIDVVFLTGGGRLRGSLVSAESRNVFLRLAQYERFKDEAFRLELARQVVTAKITGQKRVLARHERNHPERIDAGARDELDRLLGEAETASTVDTLRGVEGAASGVYFGQFGKMLASVGFPGRKKRPSTDPANSLLSLGYVLVGNELGSLLEARGFDPAIGFLHGVRYGRKSLALDVVEPFRQPLVDRLTLRILNLRQLGPDDFEGGEKGLRLREGPIKLYFELYEEQLRAPSEGEGSPSWRQRLTDQVEALRDMVMGGEVTPLYTWSG
ncbi:MAG: CRISPR-associated endonuclease Cas1 [Gemmatimonadota bacterium]